MPQNSIFTRFISLILCCCFLLSVVFSQDAYAVYDSSRGRSNFSDDGNCKVDGFKKFAPWNDDIDMEWELTNPVCISFLVGVGAAMSAADYFSAAQCVAVPANVYGNATTAQELASESALTSFPLAMLNPMVYLRLILRQTRCSARISNSVSTAATVASNCAGPLLGTPTCVFWQAALVAANADATRCCAATAAFVATVGASAAALAIIWDTARISFENGKICGHEWQAWEKDDDNVWRFGRGKYRKCIEHLFLDNHPDLNDSKCHDVLFDEDDISETFGSNSIADKHKERDITNKFYREFIYGGKEFKDNSNHPCTNPGNSDWRKENLGYSDRAQRYYMTGPGQAPVYSCERFLATNVSSSDAAYQCCREKSQTTICIESKAGLGNALGDTKYSFCKKGEKCTVANVVFDVYESIQQSNYVCAKTYSVCPYNHPLGGGTEEEEYYEVPAGGAGTSEIKNFCQFAKHCSKIPVAPYIRTTELDGEFIAASCKDLKGDSQNVWAWSHKGQVSPVRGRHFTAPMAQCFKETMENIFLNKAGDSKCLDPNEEPDANGICTSGNHYIKGETLSSTSVFEKIQNALRGAIKMGLIVAVMVFGFQVLIGVPKQVIDKKYIATFLIKISLVMYFAVGDAWQGTFASNVMGISSFMSELTFRVDEDKEDELLDGCQFPRFNHLDNSDYTNKSYANQNQYLRIWDTLDCKMAMALGFGPEVTVPNLIMMILGGLFTAGVGILFVIAAFFFAFLFIEIAIKALHIFLLSTTAVVILLYVSPITITLAMFERTKGIFSGWWKQLLGFSLQPMILFAYLGMMITMFDIMIVGDATFSGGGNGNPKKIICDSSGVTSSLDNSNSLFRVSNLPLSSSDSQSVTQYYDSVIKISMTNASDIEDAYNSSANTTKKAVNSLKSLSWSDFSISNNASDTSIYCIFHMSSLKTYHGLEAIGIGLPMLTNMTPARILTIIKAAFVMFIFMKFMDQISSFAKELVGGSELKSDWKVSAGDMAKSTYENLRGIQKRGGRALLKHGPGAARAVIDGASSKARDMGASKGKSVADIGPEGKDASSSSKQGQASQSRLSRMGQSIGSGMSSARKNMSSAASRANQAMRSAVSSSKKSDGSSKTPSNNNDDGNSKN